MENDFKDVFVTDALRKPMEELEELNVIMRKKKAELRKAIFYAKHPELAQAKQAVESKVSEEKVVKFNESVKEPEPIREKPAPAVQATVPAVKEIKSEPAITVTRPAPQHVKAPIRLGWGEKLF
jgi:hypothetical protein